jgi:hypothetical protein
MQNSLSIPPYKLILYRLFEDTGIFISLVFVIYLKYIKDDNIFKISLIILSLFIFVLLNYQMINSRMQILILIISHFILQVIFYKKFRYKMVITLIITSFILVIFIRSCIVLGNNTKISNILIEIYNEKSLNQQLNDIDILARINNSSKGLMFGKSWKNPLLVNYCAIFNKKESKKSKSNLETNTKVNIIRYYFSSNAPDIPLSNLTDIYLNFSFVGIFIVSIIIGLIIKFLSKNLYFSSSNFKLYISLFFITSDYSSIKEIYSTSNDDKIFYNFWI